MMINEELKEKPIQQWDPKYSEKRKYLMLWLNNYGECCGLKRETIALAQFYCDLFYKSMAYFPKKAKITLAAFQ